jgi:SAM-dependent methyltransferase
VTSRPKPYRWLAEYYDEFFSSFRYAIDAQREHVLGRILPEIERACDLACGTGITALKLARRGIRMYAVDQSPIMCRITREKAQRSAVRVRVLRADMRRLRLPEPVDLITCEGDAMNHVPRKRDLRTVAKSAARALRPGGYFFFDVNNALGFQTYWAGVLCFETPDVVLVMRDGHNREATKAWCDIDWFIRNGRSWQRQRERVQEVCWDFREIRGALRDAGFDQVRSWDAAPFFHDEIIGPGCRTVYLARKSRSMLVRDT